MEKKTKTTKKVTKNEAKRVENRVDQFPSKEEIDKIVAQLNEIKTKLQPFCISLDGQERISRLTPKRGNEKHATLLLSLAKEYKPPVSGVSPEAMERDIALYKALEPLAAVLAPLAQTITDTYRQAGHEYWQAFFAYYSALSGASGWNPELASAIKPIADFMAQKEQPAPTEPTK
jgi:hypothetical protein